MRPSWRITFQTISVQNEKVETCAVMDYGAFFFNVKNVRKLTFFLDLKSIRLQGLRSFCELHRSSSRCFTHQNALFACSMILAYGSPRVYTFDDQPIIDLFDYLGTSFITLTANSVCLWSCRVILIGFNTIANCNAIISSKITNHSR